MSNFNLSAAFSHYTLSKIGDAPAPWKLSCLTNTPFGLFVGIYNSVTRNNSKIFLNDKEIYNGPEETIGQGLVNGSAVGFAGECGNMLIWENGSVKKLMALKFSSHCAMFKGVPYVFNTDGDTISALNCLTSKCDFTLAGGGIVMQSISDGGNIFAATCDEPNGNCGITGNDGTLFRIKDCLCFVKYGHRVLASSGNKVLEWNGEKFAEIGYLPCEKIMHMHVNDKLWIAGSGPDMLWVYDGQECYEVQRFPVDAPVGGSLFRTRVTDGYFGRCAGGNRAEVYKIIP